ncbi:MAG: CoA-binding protein [Bdellovibrionales bacterium]|nr:CoA-binding protein [Bdellovibrionales bacterium]
MTDSEIKKILQTFKKVTVVGISSNASRPSFDVSRFLMDHGYEIDGVNPKDSEVHGRPIYVQLKDVPHPLEIVDVFRAPEHVPDLVEELIPLKPKVIWLQEGVSHPEAEAKARKAGIQVVADLCIKKEIRRLLK